MLKIPKILNLFFGNDLFRFCLNPDNEYYYFLKWLILGAEGLKYYGLKNNYWNTDDTDATDDHGLSKKNHCIIKKICMYLLHLSILCSDSNALISVFLKTRQKQQICCLRCIGHIADLAVMLKMNCG